MQALSALPRFVVAPAGCDKTFAVNIALKDEFVDDPGALNAVVRLIKLGQVQYLHN